MRSLLFLVFLYTFSPATLAKGSCEEHLTAEQIAALKDASRGDYIVFLSHGLVDGIARTVVLLGESHVKNSADDVRGKNVVDQFSHIGAEGALGFKESLIGRATIKLAAAMYKIFEMLGKKPSTIKYAIEKSEANPDRRMFRIEEGHELNRREKTRVLISAATMLPGLTRFGLYTYLTGAFMATAIHDGHYWMAAGLPLGVLKMAGFLEIAINFLSHAVGYEGFKEQVYDEAFSGRRNTHMAAKILEEFKKDPELKQMLVITGMNHTNLVSWELQQQSGFATKLLNQ